MMDSMQKMRDHMLSRCFKKDGWPKPFVYLGGAVELARDQAHWDRLYKQEVWIIATAVPAALILVAVVFFVL